MCEAVAIDEVFDFLLNVKCCSLLLCSFLFILIIRLFLFPRINGLEHDLCRRSMLLHKLINFCFNFLVLMGHFLKQRR